MRTTRAIAVMVCAAALALPAAEANANPAQRTATMVNDFRAAHGLKKLRLSGSLSRSAQAYGRHLLVIDRFGHSSRIRASGRFRMLGENLAFRWGWSRSARWPVRAWSRSAAHRGVMLNPKFRYLGIGRATGRFGSRRATVWILHAGR